MKSSAILDDARSILDDTIRLRMLVNESALAAGIAMHVAVALRFLERAR